MASKYVRGMFAYLALAVKESCSKRKSYEARTSPYGTYAVLLLLKKILPKAGLFFKITMPEKKKLQTIWLSWY